MTTAPAAPLDLGAVAAFLERPDPFRPVADYEEDIPLRLLDPAPWNPKPAISGPYRRGLATSLGEFTLRSRLLVWADRRRAGRFITLDGNQRLDVVAEMAEDHLVSLEAARRFLEGGGDPADPVNDPTTKAGRKRLGLLFEELRADAAFSASCRSRAHDLPIPCRVLGLSPDDAKLFTAAYDRNRSKYDEAKLVDLVDGIAGRQRALIDRLVRPVRPFVPPPAIAAPAPAPEVAPPAPVLASTETGSTPTLDADGDDMPWGPPPAPEPTPTQGITRDAAPREQLIPTVFSFLPEFDRELKDGLLGVSSRLLRNQRVKQAVEAWTGADPNADLSEAALEVALICFNRRAAIAAG